MMEECAICGKETKHEVCERCELGGNDTPVREMSDDDFINQFDFLNQGAN